MSVQLMENKYFDIMCITLIRFYRNSLHHTLVVGSAELIFISCLESMLMSLNTYERIVELKFFLQILAQIKD